MIANILFLKLTAIMYLIS